MAEQQMKVAANLQQDFTVSQKAQARKNIDAADNKGYVTCYLPFSDSSWSDIWYKLCELEPGTSNSYSYNYELSMKLVCTNNGDGDCPAESAQVDIGCNFIPRLNVGRCECTFADHTVSDHDQQTILGIKILTHRASDNYGPRDKAEVWVKASKYFTSETQMRVECLMNAGSQFYRSNYSSPTLYTLPWVFRNTTITGTHTDPFNDANHPEAQGYGAEGWSEVWYPAETKTVMVDHPQDFTDTEKETARTNIGAADGKIPWVEYHESQPVPSVTRSGLSVVTSDRGSRIQNDDASIQYYVAPPPATGDAGKVLGVNTVGTVTWINVDPPDSIETEMYRMDYVSTGAGNNTTAWKSWSIPSKDGRYPSKVVGNFWGNIPNISIVPAASANIAIDPNVESIDIYQNINIGAPVSGWIPPDNNNAYCFPFQFNESVSGNDLRNIVIKGRGYVDNTPVTGYSFWNCEMQCFWER